MVTTICLLTCALATGQANNSPDWLLSPRLNRGQELVYRGTIQEENLGRGVQFSRGYRLESRVFILESSPRGLDAALLTVLKMRGIVSEPGKETDPSSVRLEVLRLDPQGRLITEPGSPHPVALDGPTTVETGALFEIPRLRFAVGQSWDQPEAGRPVRKWKVIGTETISGSSCFKLEGLQQSEDWDLPRADHTAWKRRDLVWLSSRLGVAYRVERTIERREPARVEPTQRSVTRYELESSLQYPGQLFDDRRREIVVARSFADSAAPLLPAPGKYSPQLFDTLLNKINAHLQSSAPTPYREAVQLVKRRVEAARRGESPAQLQHRDDALVQVRATIDQKAPDFVASNLLTKESVRLYRLLGKPVLLVFYSPTSPSATEVLRFTQNLADTQGDKVSVAALSLSDDVDLLRKQQTELGLTFPILAGKGMRQSFAIEATPRLLVLDGAGYVRATYEGWGPETSGGITTELKRLLAGGTNGGAPGAREP